MTLLSLVLAAVLPAAAAPATKGYVVKAEGARVWLDLTAADGAAPGRAFQVYTEGEELKHPVTGENLGKEEKVIADGKITELAEKHSVGELPAPNETIKAGARARLGAALPPPAPAPAPAPQAYRRPGEAELRAPKSRGAALPVAALAMAAGDFDATGKPQLVLADERRFHLYAYPAAGDAPLATGEVPGVGARVVSLEAADLDGDKKAELFVSVYNEPFRRFETVVFVVEAGKWLKKAELPWLVRSHQDGKGARVLASQQIQDDKTFPFSGVFPLVYEDGRYKQGKPGLAPKRANWIYGFTFAALDPSETAALYLTSVNTLRAEFKKGHWRTKESYGQSPVRVRWHEKLLEFHPPMPALYGEKGFEGLFVARNLAALGGLANPFGVFNDGEIQRLAWNGVAFETVWKGELGGAALGIAVVEPEAGRKELAVAVSGSAGKTAVWVYDP
jgi:hypothetical protein